MFNRRALLKSGALALGAAALDLRAMSGPVARTSTPTVAELDRNENPCGPPESSKRAMIQAINRGNRYLDGSELDLFRDQIAAREGVKREWVVLGSGSSEILWMAAVEFLEPGQILLLGHPTFELIGRCAEQQGATVERVPVNADQFDDLNRLEESLKKSPQLVYLCHPNNPCGTILNTTDLRNFVTTAARQGPVLVDEAYLEYSDPLLKTSMADLVRAGHDVMVARTFSKIFGLAGMRMGYAIARPETVRRLARHRFSVLSSLGLAAASAALRETTFIDTARKRNAEGKAIITAAFDARGVRHIPSATNFVWFDQSGIPGLPQKAREAEILIPHGRFEDGWNRVTVGTIEEAERFAAAVRAAV